MSKEISVGKARALQQTANERNLFTILAVDHRDSMRVMINPDDINAVPAEVLTQTKIDICKILAPHSSAVMLDPVYGGGQAITAGAMPRGWICSMEEQGYLGDPHMPKTPMLEGWSVEKAKLQGATGIKILMKYHPDSGDVAQYQQELVAKTLEEGERWQIPLFLEPIVYPLDPNVNQNSVEFAAQKPELVMRTAKTFSDLGADVLKMEFPINVNINDNEDDWERACVMLNGEINVPWVLLSAGVTHEIFKKQLQIACQSGASGFLAGRAIWREAVLLSGHERRNFLQKEALQRLRELTAITTTYATPWTKRYQMPEVNQHWYKS